MDYWPKFLPAIKKESSNETKSKMQTVTKFGYKTSYTVIPTKAVSLNQDDYELSQTAVNALREIEKCLVYDRSVVNDRCAIFFDKFGSHYYTGTYHFGGIYQKIATVEIDKEISTSEATNMCEKALRARFKATYNAGIANASGGFSASRSSGATSGEENTTSTEDSKVNVSQRKIGGPQETDDILAWKEGLVSTRDTWQIIDREDMSYSKFDGIWKLILCCTSSFQDPISLVLAVLEAWESVSGITNKTDNYVYIDLLDKLIGKLTYQCVGDKLNPDSLKGLLQALDKVTEKLKENVVADDIWDKKCSLHVREFLKNVETCCSSRESCILAGRLLKKFKKPATSISVKTILGELRNAHKRFYSVDICDVDGLNALQNETTNSLQKSFLRLRDTDLLQFIFFASSLYALGKEMLDVSEMRFQHNMSQHNLKNMIENADNCCEDFKAFDRITRGDVDTEEIIQCLKRLISSLKRIANDENLSQQCLDYLGKDTRTQAFVEVVSRHLSTTTDTRKSSILDLLMELIDTERGIGLQKWRTIIALLEMAASDGEYLI